MIQSYLVHILLIIRPFHWVKKIIQKQKGRLWIHETQTLEAIFETPTENSFVITNDTQEKPLGRYFQVLPPYYQTAQCNQNTPIPVSSRWQVRFEKANKGQASTLITANTSIHLPKPVSTDLTRKSDSVLTNPIGKDRVQGLLM